jgi:hypothetical protein
MSKTDPAKPTQLILVFPGNDHVGYYGDAVINARELEADGTTSEAELTDSHLAIAVDQLQAFFTEHGIDGLARLTVLYMSDRLFAASTSIIAASQRGEIENYAREYAMTATLLSLLPRETLIVSMSEYGADTSATAGDVMTRVKQRAARA